MVDWGKHKPRKERESKIILRETGFVILRKERDDVEKRHRGDRESGSHRKTRDREREGEKEKEGEERGG
ncbi:hypothetical protein ACFX1Q_024766 [Malus domestica]